MALEAERRGSLFLLIQADGFAALNSSVRAHMRRFGLLIAPFLLMTSGVCAAAENSFSLQVSSDLGPTFVVVLSPSGMLTVTRSGVGLIAPAAFHKQVTTATQRELILLAHQSNDFEFACETPIPDGTNVTLDLRYLGKEIRRSVTLCSQWPKGEKTAKWLSATNRQLPSEIQVH
jgi:hypothetical protein